jgi:hypothetical protein
MLMREYKVICENNMPTEATLLNFINYNELIRLTTAGKKKFIMWLVVAGKDEMDTVEAAGYILKTFWLNYLRQILS